ncbi:hypothetical protein Tco_0506353 [Tanacetum coccineum]
MSTQQDMNAIRAQRPANTHVPLALMTNTQIPFHPDHSLHITYVQHPQPNNNFFQQPSFNMNCMQQLMQDPEDISDPTTALDMALELIQIAQSGMNQDKHMLMVDDNVRNQFRHNIVQNVGHLVGQNAVQNLGIQIVENMNRLSVVLEIANQYGNDYPIWEVIQKGNGPVSVSTDTNGVVKILPPKTVEENLAREREERKARTTLIMALPEDHLAKFHKMTDAKDMWDAIKSRFGGNDESKKMQNYILKQQFEGFSVSNSEGLHKGYDRFQSLLSQLEIHGAGVSTEDANQKFLRSLPSSWSQVSFPGKTKPGVDNLSIDDLYNNLRVFESDNKGSTGSSSSAKNVAFVSSESTSSTNDVSTANGVSTSSGYNSQRENSSSYTDEIMYSFFANQSSGPHLDHEDLEQLDEFDLEEMDLKC